MGKKKSTFKNVMITLGCTAFAGVYVLGGGYLVSNYVVGDNGAMPAWLERVEIHVKENASNNTVTDHIVSGNVTAGTEGTGDGYPVENNSSGHSGNGDRSNSGNSLQKPRFEEQETETDTETEQENVNSKNSGDKEPETETEIDTDTDIETEQETENETETSESDESDKSGAETDETVSDETETETMTTDETESGQSKKTQKDDKAKGDFVKVDQAQTIDQEDKALAVMADVTAVVKTAMPCVVSITNEYTAYDYWYDEEYDEKANGSGIVVAQSDEELLIVTNYHVIEDNNNLYVQFIDNAEANAYVKGASPENDLAIVSVFLEDMSDETLESIAIAALGDSDSLQVGEPAIAIGNSLGYGQSVTTGVISALNRNVFADEPDMIPGYLIQTDAAINPGNSGGALLNVKGEVIGINSSKIADYVIEGMGYAIPISTAKPIIEDLMQKETRRKVPEEERAFLGIAGTDVIEEATARYEMPEGVYVSDVIENTAADAAGIQKGDIIVYIDGERIKRMDQLQGLLEYYAADTEVEVVLMRQSNGEYKERTVSVKLGYKE